MSESPRLSEPMTMVTDFVLAVVAATFAVLVLPAPEGEAVAARVAWSAAFALTAAAALLGGVFHGVRERLGQARAERVWRGTLLLSVAGSAALLVAAGLQLAPAGMRWAVAGAAVAKALVAMLVLRRAGRFGVVLWDAGLSVAVVLAMALLRWGIGGEAAAGWVAAGAIVALAGGVVQLSRRGLPLHLDHNDLFHLAQTLACYLLYRGATGA